MEVVEHAVASRQKGLGGLSMADQQVLQAGDWRATITAWARYYAFYASAGGSILIEHLVEVDLGWMGGKRKFWRKEMAGLQLSVVMTGGPGMSINWTPTPITSSSAGYREIHQISAMPGAQIWLPNSPSVPVERVTAEGTVWVPGGPASGLVFSKVCAGRC